MTVPAIDRPRPAAARTPSGGGRARFAQPECHDLRLTPMSDGPGRDLPALVTLLRPDPSRPADDQLFLDGVPVACDAWSYDAHDRVLSWHGAYDGGHLRLVRDGRGGYGTVGPVLGEVAVTAAAVARFTCEVALGCGASYESSGTAVVGLLWDTASTAWTSATWSGDRLALSYTVTPATGTMHHPRFAVEFADLVTAATPWAPAHDTFEAELALGVRGGRTVWRLGFASSTQPDPDTGTTTPASAPATVYPFWLQAVEDAAASTIDGVLEIDDVAPKGTLVGFRGVRAAASVTGYYRAAPGAAPFGVFDGRLQIDGAPVGDSRVMGGRLCWSGLSPEHQRRTGLPAEGGLGFTADGSRAVGDDGSLRVARLAPASALAAIAQHADLHPRVHARATAFAAATATPVLDIPGLLTMTPFAVDKNGAWGDAVQAAVTDDLGTIMQSFVPSSLWSSLLPGVPQPTLSGALAAVAASPVTGVTDPADWYRSLATAVMVQGMADGSDPNCKYLNGPRAAAWLKAEVATSPVYAAHAAALFAIRWQERWPATSDYLADQATHAAAYQNQITATRDAEIAEITAHVAVDASSPANLEKNLIADVRAVAQYAMSHKLFWAFAFYTYNAAPASLASLANGTSPLGGSSDTTGLMRLFQQNMAVLTALDPSGYFARRYTASVNTFLTTNLLPGMFGFRGDAMDAELLKEYLQTFATNNASNPDPKMAAAAAGIQAILADPQAGAILRDSVEAVRAIAESIDDTLALPFVAKRFVARFAATYPRFAHAADVFGSLFMVGVTGLAVYSMVTGCASFDKLTPTQRTTLVLDTVQLGLQVVAAVVQRGVRVYAIFGVDAMTAGQRAAAVSWIVLRGEAGRLDAGLLKIGNATARWLGDTQGSAGRLATSGAAETTAVLVSESTVAFEDMTWAVRVLGRNLEELIATRIGPLFILAGIGVSIWSIATGDAGVALASDILTIVGGSLTVFATVGSWLMSASVIAVDGAVATMITIAGPLAILAALAGAALLIWEMFQRPPDPVDDFVQHHAAPAGLTVSAAACAVDYATCYADPDQGGLLMVGATIGVGGQTLTAAPDGSIALGAASARPDCVWRISTDGWGMCTISTVLQPAAAPAPVRCVLSLMSDGTVCFLPAGSTPAAGSPAMVTQTWTTMGGSNEVRTSDGHLRSVVLTLLAMRAPAGGAWPPTAPDFVGYVTVSGGAPVLGSGTAALFTVAMSGMAPNLMRMADVPVLLGSTPSTELSYGPTFGVRPSTPTTYALTGSALPKFLTFDATAGTLTPNGGKADTAATTTATITATNALGTDQAAFAVTVAPPGVQI